MLYLTSFKQDRDHHLKYALLGAFPPALHSEFEEQFHVTAREVYGMTEIGIGARVPFEIWHMVGSGRSASRPISASCASWMRTETMCPWDRSESCWSKARHFKGYYRKPAENAKAFVGEYFRTGDLFRQDEDGNYYFVSRKKDMIRRMGDNISASEVEQVLMSHPKIAEAAVVPVPDRCG